jgi:predicted enzyme related to lactoylglutathione lyase
MPHIFRLELRTTDLAGARVFYRGVLGERRLDLAPLPPEAAARGAVPHWLAHLGVADVEATARAFVERGAARLGPTHPTATGVRALLRDPGGAVVALASEPDAPPTSEWHLLCTADLARTVACYCEVLGWSPTGRPDFAWRPGGASVGVDIPPGPDALHPFAWRPGGASVGVDIPPGPDALHPFAWRPGGASVGAFVDIRDRPGVHPHWLPHFAVPALAPAVAAVRAGGGAVADTFTLATGHELAVGEDPQGAAFALLARA